MNTLSDGRFFPQRSLYQCSEKTLRIIGFLRSGYGYGKIAQRVGVSRQRVHEIHSKLRQGYWRQALGWIGKREQA